MSAISDPPPAGLVDLVEPHTETICRLVAGFERLPAGNNGVYMMIKDDQNLVWETATRKDCCKSIRNSIRVLAQDHCIALPTDKQMVAIVASLYWRKFAIEDYAYVRHQAMSSQALKHQIWLYETQLDNLLKATLKEAPGSGS
jgi:hypothetical protein